MTEDYRRYICSRCGCAACGNSKTIRMAHFSIHILNLVAKCRNRVKGNA
jgi:hypothetical protein